MNDKFNQLMAEVFEVNKELIDNEFELNKDNWDSLAILSTIAIIDELYGITVPGTALFGCKTIGEIQKLVQSHLSNK